ncbi:hypothetical protein HPB50_012316 [Hyalomma asiaticum]|uniref:Uncharacterized protein n=1 Tax=Hyalomma asiaticum TaxID=266040 RepID=A0ACB7TGL6_HYAAI|nr:hypothetical protein HPB50_012316 [Hyalomma asiaticum]
MMLSAVEQKYNSSGLPNYALFTRESDNTRCDHPSTASVTWPEPVIVLVPLPLGLHVFFSKKKSLRRNLFLEKMLATMKTNWSSCGIPHARLFSKTSRGSIFRQLKTWVEQPQPGIVILLLPLALRQLGSVRGSLRRSFSFSAVSSSALEQKCRCSGLRGSSSLS